MEFTILSRKLNQSLTYSRPGSEYIYVDLNGSSGTLGQQICAGGGLRGSTLTYYGDDYNKFARICKLWHRVYVANSFAD